MTTATTGIFPDMPAGDYFARPGINQSGLKALLQSPARYRYQLIHKSKPSAAAELGTDVHTAVLEPGRFSQQTVIMPKFAASKGTTIAAQTAEWLGSLPPGCRTVPAAHFEKVTGMRDAVLANPTAKKLLEAGKAETSFFWEDPVFEVLCKGRADFISDFAGGCVVDLKTSSSVAEADFSRSIVDPKLRYDLQAAHYLAAGEVTGAYRPDLFFFIVVSSSEPYECVVYEADAKLIALGREWREHAMALYADCVRTNQWQPPAPFATISPPPWARGPA